MSSKIRRPTAKAATTQTMTADAATTTSQSLSFNGFSPGGLKVTVRRCFQALHGGPAQRKMGSRQGRAMRRGSAQKGVTLMMEGESTKATLQVIPVVRAIYRHDQVRRFRRIGPRRQLDHPAPQPRLRLRSLAVVTVPATAPPRSGAATIAQALSDAPPASSILTAAWILLVPRVSDRCEVPDSGAIINDLDGTLH